MDDSLQRKKKIYTIIYFVSCAVLTIMGLADSILTIVSEFTDMPDKLCLKLSLIFTAIGLPALGPLFFSWVKLRSIKKLSDSDHTEAPTDTEASDVLETPDDIQS